MSVQHTGKLLIAEKDSAICDTLVEYFRQVGYEVWGVKVRSEIVAQALDKGCGVIILDYHLSAGEHPEILDQLIRADASACVILITSYPLIELVIDAYRRGASDVVPKPLDLFEMSEVVERAFKQHELKKVYGYVRRNLDRVKQLMEEELRERPVGSHA
ncbi:MAG: response regulator [Candidatus Zixiibacteriota bacterium]|nr:MAG: response regulator [candidate division Zixibacteria bacterium]